MPTVDLPENNRHSEVHIWGSYATFRIDYTVGYRRGRFVRFFAANLEEEIS